MAEKKQQKSSTTQIDERWQQELLKDFELCCISRETSLLGRKEVLTGKAKFGIFGDGKELAQVAMARYFENGDFRSGYYRDQTFMFAIGQLNVQQYFAALYAHTDLDHEPTSGGRQMGGHFATRSLDENGDWKNLMEQKNSSPDISPTAGQMPRLLGLAQASTIYRAQEDLHDRTQFTNKGNEVAFGTIGDASTSEGLFWETMNAACVLKVPMLMSVWDDGYGISVPKEFQTVKASISEALSGFATEGDDNGLRIFKAKGWNYPQLMAVYEEASNWCRTEHRPALIHVEEVTQPQGHSTSGSHERYKSPERLAWAEEYDCIAQFSKFLILEGAATQDELDEIRKAAKKEVRNQQKEAWKTFRDPIQALAGVALQLLKPLATLSEEIGALVLELEKNREPIKKEIYSAVRQVLILTVKHKSVEREQLQKWLQSNMERDQAAFSDKLFSDSAQAVEYMKAIPAEYSSEPQMEDGRVILRENFRKLFAKYPEVLTFGEDTGKIGGVNQSMEGMQEEFGAVRVSDTGIREATILGQGIGMSMRGLRPIAEIQYLDYLYYALQIMRDDLATVQYRTRGGQKAPLIVRTRGHRLEGIWHSGSPMAAIINSIRGMHVCVPRNMTKAAGMYNGLLQCDEPALVVECLNGYRTKEPMPTNLGEFTVPLGEVETIREGSDITMVSYGSTLHLCAAAAERLSKLGIEVELIDVQTLLPFDNNHDLVDSLKETNRLIVVDEDVPSGTSAYILNEILHHQKGYRFLDSQPVTVSAEPHLPAYSTDGDYFSKPSIEDIVERTYAIFHEADPAIYPAL